MSEFVIVGAGPVGLFLATLLAGSGREVTVLERALEVNAHGRSIGIHPPALEALAQAGVAGSLVSRAAVIRRARVFVEGREPRSVELAACPPPYPFVLSLPQGETERQLEERLAQLAPTALRRGCRVSAVERAGGNHQVRLESGEVVSGGVLLGCDGRDSLVRSRIPVTTRGRAHRHHYLMADLPDEGASVLTGSEAGLFLDRRGVVESFPLPHARRRWVAKVRRRPASPTFDALAEAIHERTGVHLRRPDPDPVTAFTAETRLAERLAGPGWALVGDAAHVISPIGGQGMNLGLLGAHLLWQELMRGGRDWHERYGSRQRARARAAARRASLNMALGAEDFPPALRRLFLAAILHPRLETRVARFFTMRGL